MKKSSRKIQPGDRIYTPSGVGGTCISFEHRLCKVKWDNGREALYTAREIDKYDYRISAPEPEGQDIAEEELSLFDQPLLISREWKIGDRCQLAKAKSAGIITDINGASVRVLFSDAADSTGKGAWVSKEHVCRLELVDCLKASADSPVQQNLLEDSTGESQSSKVQALVKFCDRNSAIQSGKEISELSIQTRENTIYFVEDSPALIPVGPVIEPESVTLTQNPVQCSESSSELLEKPDPHSYFWNNLAALSIEDLEAGLEDSEWGDILASIRLSRDAINLERSLSGKESLSFPTLLAGHGNGHRDAGATECERWFKKSGIVPVGSQLSAHAIALLHGFPWNWFQAISSPLCTAIIDTQADLPAENSEAKPLQSPKLESPSNGLNGCGENLTIEQQLEPRNEDCLGKTVYHDVAEKLGTVTHLELVSLGDLPSIRYAHVDWWWKYCQDSKFNCDRSRVPADELELVESDKLVSPLPLSLEKQSKQSGSLYQYTANRRGKDGITREYPIVEGERRRDEDEHWYWGLSYIEKNSRGKWCDRSASIPQKSLSLARQLMREKFLYSCTIEICQLKFLWRKEQGRYLVGEIKPEACPRLCVVSLEEKDYVLSAPNWGEMRPDNRISLSRKIQSAIADNQPLEVIRGLLP